MATDRDPLGWIADELGQLDAQHLRRKLRTREGAQGPVLQVQDRQLINFGSNDYLGLANDPRLAAAASAAAAKSGWGAGASPLITGHAELHAQLERAIAEFLDLPAALLFSSGYAANVGTIAALVGREDAIFSDAKNHASIVDGCRLSRATVHIYPHCHMGVLREQLSAAGAYRRRLIVTDTVFSMDGDLAPLVDLAELAEQFGAMLMIDEAHATGVLGDHGRGWAEEQGVSRGVHVHVGTLSKALGCSGGFVAGSNKLIEWLVNRARPYVFSTAHPAAGSAAALMALEIVRTEPERREKLRAQADELYARLKVHGWNSGDSASQIIPVLIGDAERTMALADRLLAAGYWVPGIRPPSVPAGESLLRISLSSAHTPEMIEGLLAALGRGPAAHATSTLPGVTFNRDESQR